MQENEERKRLSRQQHADSDYNRRMNQQNLNDAEDQRRNQLENERKRLYLDDIRRQMDEKDAKKRK